MNTEPKLPNPMIDPSQVADAILAAAVSHTRAKKVGAMSVVNTTLAKFAPAIADRMAAKQIDSLHAEIPPREPLGALRRSSEAMHAAGHKHPVSKN
jgi:hypothetical protein